MEISLHFNSCYIPTDLQSLNIHEVARHRCVNENVNTCVVYYFVVSSLINFVLLQMRAIKNGNHRAQY